MLQNFHRVSENIYRGGIPAAKDLHILKDVYKIKRIISLDPEIGQEIAPIVKQLGIQHIIIPISASETGMTDALNYLVRNVVSLLNNNQPSFVHCRYGSDRTGLAVALYRIKHNGWQCGPAINEAKKFGFGQRISPAVQNLYKKILCGFTGPDSNSLDDEYWHDRSRVNDILPSWAPQVGEASGWTSEERVNKLQELATQIPEVGQFNNYSPGVTGAGIIDDGVLADWNK